ncbi:MAG: sodium:proton antiporter [Planctomycetes bacterium]|nr:sodium:proton antiporter [Planctomycetota bacterium]
MWVLPFVILLGCIAILPLLPATQHWWESNLHRLYVAAGLGLITLLYYLLAHGAAVDGHWPAHHVVEPSDSGWHWPLAWTIFSNAIFQEYVPFIVLLFSLYTISGGIRIEGDLAARPLTNTAFLAVGGLLASLIGTTGAAMLLIRPLLETNRERKHVAHTVVIFIFIVCNCGGCLLPIGDPPLFLGYLKGVPFLWTLSLWKEWLFVNGMLLVIYFLWDHLYHYPREKQKDIVKDEKRVRGLVITGWQLNGTLLLAIVACVALLDPSKAFPGTNWHPWLYLREICQLLLVGISIVAGSHMVRQKNQFTYAAIVEVAALFLGIFLCMQPALQILHVHGPQLGLTTPARFYWATGSLSSVLDNAPTYIVFFETAKTLPGGDLAVEGGKIDSLILTAISLGAVFMGAMTYIGNGPNFMVKALAEGAGVKMPSFFGYLKYSFTILLPLLALTCLIFLL